MNILLVIPSLSSYEGGIVSSTINFALALARQRQKVTLICLEDRDSFIMADKLRESNIEVILTKIKVKYRSPMVLFPLINYFRNILNNSIKWNMTSNCVGFDVVYRPREGTGFLNHFEPSNRIEGIQMLVYQAIPCFKLWFGVEPEIDEQLFDVLYKKMDENR